MVQLTKPNKRKGYTMRLPNGMYDSRPEPTPHVGVFRGVVRIPKKRPGPLALRALTDAQEVEDILCQLLDGDIGVSEAFDRYLAIDVEDNPAPSVDAVTIFTEALTGRVAQ